METMRETLLFELQKLWDEIGEQDNEKDTMIVQLEQDCLEVYKTKVEQTKRSKAQLRQAIANAETEVAVISSALGEQPLRVTPSCRGSFREEYKSVATLLEEMQKRKIERRDQFVEVTNQISDISNEIVGTAGDHMCKLVVDENDLSLKRLEDLKKQMLQLQNEKSNRLKQVMDHLNTLNSLCAVLGTDFKQTVNEINPSLDASEVLKGISTATIDILDSAIQRLREIKRQRKERLRVLATAMLELWNLMETPAEDQHKFQNVIRNIAADDHEITKPNSLSLDLINYAETEVSRLQQLKSSKMKELIFKRELELDDICRKTHMSLDEHSVKERSLAIDSGGSDLAYILEEMELQLAKVKEEASSRKEILEKIEKWLAACEEECWLEEYNRDQNRYNAGRGTHLSLKRAEMARGLVSKIPAMVEALTLSAASWEKDRRTEFSYDGVKLHSMLEQYSLLRKEKEQERKRQRDQKKLQGQLLVEQESLFGSKPCGQKMPRYSTNKRFSVGGAMLQKEKLEKTDCLKKNSLNRRSLSGFNVPSSGTKKLNNATQPVKKRLTARNTHENEPKPPLIQKSLVATLTSSSKVSVRRLKEEDNRQQDRKNQKLVPDSKTLISTPPKSVVGENKTTNLRSFSPPPTPLSISSVHMNTSMTPATPCRKEVESGYSFEDRRAGFFVHKSVSKTLLPV